MIENNQAPDGLECWAKELERELNAANQRIKRLEEENNELRVEEARLLNTNGELERRIKRLEGLYEDQLEITRNWKGAAYSIADDMLKAKEAKP